MGWDEVPVVLPVSAVSMDCPLGAPTDNLPTFVAYAENATDYVFYLDGNIQNTSANTFTPDSNITEGTHIVRIIASNSASSTETTCTLYVASYFQTGCYFYTTVAGELVFFISSQIINSIVDLIAETIANIYVEFIKNTPCGCDPDYEEPLTYLESLLIERLIDIGIADYLNEDGSLMFTLPNLSDILGLTNIDTSTSVRILLKNSLFIFIIPEDYNT